MKYLSFNELTLKLGGRSRSTIYRDVELGRLPKPVKIGGRIYWLEHKIDEALEHISKQNYF
jgi:predicted DNA-binding transcriptional regulator AlpA